MRTSKYALKLYHYSLQEFMTIWTSLLVSGEGVKVNVGFKKMTLYLQNDSHLISNSSYTIKMC